MTVGDASLAIEIRLGHHARLVPVESLAATLRLPSATIRAALTRLLLSSLDPDARSNATVREPTEGVRHERSQTNVTDVPEDLSPERERYVGECEGGDVALDGAALARALGDGANRAALDALVQQHPRARLRAALSITLARPPGSIRQSRGAYFTGVLRVLAAREGTPPPFHA